MKSKKYKAVLFHPEGDYVTDFSSDSKEEIWECIDNMGSRWVFYPLCFVGTCKTIVDTIPELNHLKGKRIKTASKYFNEIWKEKSDEVCDVINNGLPLSWIY